MDVLRVGVSPWAHLKPECFPSRKTGCDAGIELEILETIATMANLRLELSISNEAGCGTSPFDKGAPTNQWTGLLKMLKNDSIDMTGNFCNVNKLGNNQTFFSTSWPVWQYQEQFLIQAPSAPPLSFAPFAPFNFWVWIAYSILGLLCLALVVLNYSFNNNFPRELSPTAAFTFKRPNSEFTNISTQLIRPMWILLITTFFIFYNTYILSAVLHPLPIWRPFSDANDLADLLMSNRYRVVTFKNPPVPPVSCAGKCQQRFFEAVNKNGFAYYPNGVGFQALTTMAEQVSESEPKLVYFDGTPFISLCFEEFPYGRDRFWLIDAGAQRWSAFLWKKNFKHAKEFDRHLRNMGDYKFRALSKFVRSYGPQARTGDRIAEKLIERKISLSHFKGLFLMHLGGTAAAMAVFLAEIILARRCKARIKSANAKICTQAASQVEEASTGMEGRYIDTS